MVGGSVIILESKRSASAPSNAKVVVVRVGLRSVMVQYLPALVTLVSFQDVFMGIEHEQCL